MLLSLNLIFPALIIIESSLIIQNLRFVLRLKSKFIGLFSLSIIVINVIVLNILIWTARVAWRTATLIQTLVLEQVSEFLWIILILIIFFRFNFRLLFNLSNCLNLTFFRGFFTLFREILFLNGFDSFIDLFCCLFYLFGSSNNIFFKIRNFLDKLFGILFSLFRFMSWFLLLWCFFWIFLLRIFDRILFGLFI